MICIICSDTAEFHHLKTRKAHPELEKTIWNMIPCCRKCHTKFHSKGTNYMAVKYPQVYSWLKRNKWYIDPVLLRWEHEK